MIATWTLVIGAVLTIFLAVGAGALAREREWLTAEADRSLMDVTVRLLMPCLNLHATMTSLALRDRANLIWPPLIGIGALAAGLTLASVIARAGSSHLGLSSAGARRTFAYAAGSFNYGYIPIPLVTLLFGQDTLAVLVVFMVGVELGVWTLGVLVLTGSVGGNALRRLLNPPSLAVVAGVALNLSGIAAMIPPFVVDVVTLFANAAIPVGLLLVGALMADHLHEAWRGSSLRVGVAAGLIRGLLAPALLIWIAAIAPLSLELRRVLVVEAAMPAAMFSLVISRYYGGDGPTALRVVLATSLLAVVAIPIWLTWGLTLIPAR
jgi:predicted permease